MRDLDDYARAYARAPFEPVQAHIRRKHVLAAVRAAAPATLLEVGCGLAPLFTDLPGTACDVVEPAAVFAAAAREAASGRANVRIHAVPIETFDAVPPAGYDMVVVSGLLHEVDAPEAVLRAIARLARPDTLVHANVPNAHSLHRLLGVAMGLLAAPGALTPTQRALQQRSVFTADSLADLAARAGFEVTGAGSWFVKPFTHAQMQQLLDSGFLTPQLLDGLDALSAMLPGHGSEIWLHARPRRA